MTLGKLTHTATHTATHVAGGALRGASGVARRSLRTSARAVGLTRGVVRGVADVGVAVVRGATGSPGSTTARPDERWGDATDQADAATPAGSAPAGDEPVVREPVTDQPDPRDDLPGPDVVAPDLPRPEDLPEPVVIEAEDPPAGEEFHTEPKAAGRESEHGGPPGDREEVEGYVEEVLDPASPHVDVETPVGTTGADVGTNPDTAESDLQQPGTPPLADPAAVAAVISESETLRRDAERNPGDTQA